MESHSSCLCGLSHAKDYTRHKAFKKMHEVADKCVRHKFGPVCSRMRVRKHCVQKKKKRRKRRVNFFSACLGDFFSFYQTRVTSWDQVCLSAFPLVWLQKNLSANVVALP